MGRVFAVLDAPAEEEEPAEPAASPQGPCGLKLEHVTFGYEPGKPVWQDLSLEIQPGEAVALVGESGSGKSTLFKLLMGLYQPQEGRITVDGKELGQMGLDQWRQHFAYVQQDGGLFDRTIGENIALGCGGTLDQQALDRAAEDAGALPVIQAMPLGYEQPVGEGGRALSGGQRQRIAIARGLAAQAPTCCRMSPPLPWTPRPKNSCARPSAACRASTPSSSSPTAPPSAKACATSSPRRARARSRNWRWRRAQPCQREHGAGIGTAEFPVCSQHGRPPLRTPRP